MAIPIFDKFKSVTEEGVLLDYDEIADIPIIRRDLTLGESLPDGYYIHTGETTQMFTNGRIYHRSGNTYDEIAPGKDALIMTNVATLGHAADVVPEVFGTYYLSATFNREFEDNEFCFGLVTASNRDYAVIGKVFHVDDELRIQIYTLCDITSSEPLILTSGRTTTLPTAGATCFLSQESYNRDWVSGETIFGIVGYIESNTIVGRYAVVGTIYDNSPRIVVSSVSDLQPGKGDKGDSGKDALILKSGTTNSVISTQYSCTIDNPVFSREYISNESCFALLTKNEKMYAVIGTVHKNADGSIVQIKPTTVLDISAGKTPQKGTDYWTEEDKEEIVNEILARLPVYNGEVL